MKVLVTGGAGFLGSHLVDALVARGDEVYVVDNLERQAHPDGIPSWINDAAQYDWCDFRDAPSATTSKSFDGIIHLAAATGTGQSMYEGASYTRANAELTAFLADELVSHHLNAERVVFASSRAVYGEGTRECLKCGRVRPGVRARDAIELGRWDPDCPLCGSITTWRMTQESDLARPVSVYGATKLYGELVLDLLSESAASTVVSLRFFNLYGSRQTPANPYVGVASTFAGLALAGRPITLFEDGEVLRDFLHVSDAVRAICRALDRTEVLRGPINIGSGHALSLFELATAIAAGAGTSLDKLGYSVNGLTRAGDLRACIADGTRAYAELGWKATTSLEDGVGDLLEFVEGASMTDPSGAVAELERLGLLMGTT
jgi:dTDP-L-rhamnose 4-epimerase